MGHHTHSYSMKNFVKDVGKVTKPIPQIMRGYDKHTNFKILRENHRNHENHIIPTENLDNHENHNIPLEKQENHVNLKIQC